MQDVAGNRTHTNIISQRKNNQYFKRSEKKVIKMIQPSICATKLMMIKTYITGPYLS